MFVNSKRGKRRVVSRNSRFVDEDGFPDPYEVRTFGDLLEYNRELHPELSQELNDPNVEAYLRRYYAYVQWNEHGNGPDFGEDAKFGYMINAVWDLTHNPDSQFTDYLTAYGDADSVDNTAKELLAQRAGIQRFWGLQPDFVSFSKKPGRSRR